MKDGALLQVENLTKAFPLGRSLADALRGRPQRALQALGGVSLSVNRGETLGVVGESGCGKSTLARCLVRLYEPDCGAVRFEGKDVLGLTGEARRSYHRRVQMVFQDPYASLNPRLSVGDALAEALTVHRIVEPSATRDRVGALLDLVHLPRDAADRYPHEFSGGQRQRVGIARALAVEPSVIIADEPVSALDVSVQAQVVNLFLELQDRLGLSLVFITHDLRLVRHVSHRLAVMYLGKVVETGDTEAVFTAPRHPYTRALIAAVPQVDPHQRSTREAVRGELPSPIAPPPGCPFHPRCPIAEPRCRTEVPALDRRHGGWPVACHLAGAPST
ncbi:ABC transporter ATP-binding protein [Alsobacter soli]|uniref:ABC transporter ATP-binding protein n=1 Tax=Alsobacter soli TaxID=2109933 RepID=UPI001AECD69F|nr:oligopeptide/dipeptide ABC transporter ATP-binding protein [Alsobacter soli]